MNTERTIRVMICDDIESIVERYALVLQSDPGIQVVGCVYSGKAAIDCAIRVHPDVILMDIEMETCEAGIIATRQILAKLPHVKIVVLTIHETDHLIFEAFSAGVVDYLLKNVAAENIIRSVKDAADNNTSVSPVVFRKLRAKVTQFAQEQESTMAIINRLFRLTRMEIEVLSLFIAGMNRNQISKHRFVEMSTTKSQVHSILTKTEFSSISELVKTLRLLQLDHLVQDMLSNDGLK